MAKIIIELKQEFTEEEVRQMRFVMGTALDEFLRRREPAEAYVADRYKDESYEYRVQKIRQVRTACKIASAMHEAILMRSTQEK